MIHCRWYRQSFSSIIFLSKHCWRAILIRFYCNLLRTLFIPIHVPPISISSLTENSRLRKNHTQKILLFQSLGFCICWLPLNSFGLIMDLDYKVRKPFKLPYPFSILNLNISFLRVCILLKNYYFTFLKPSHRHNLYQFQGYCLS